MGVGSHFWHVADSWNFWETWDACQCNYKLCVCKRALMELDFCFLIFSRWWLSPSKTSHTLRCPAVIVSSLTRVAHVIRHTPNSHAFCGLWPLSTRVWTHSTDTALTPNQNSQNITLLMMTTSTARKGLETRRPLARLTPRVEPLLFSRNMSLTLIYHPAYPAWLIRGLK